MNGQEKEPLGLSAICDDGGYVDLDKNSDSSRNQEKKGKITMMGTVPIWQTW